MDLAAFAHSAFGGLPNFDPMMFVNVSSTCATTKLLQCRDFGTYEADISRKFQRGPQGAPDLHQEDFYARKRVPDQVAAWVERKQEEKRKGSLDEWVPILYHFEIARSAAKRTRDWGHIVFTDLTTTRFLLVMCFGAPECDCGNPFHHDYDSLTKYQADRFMSLLSYLWHDEGQPEWVRATYTTLAAKEVSASFIDPLAEQPDTSSPPVFHVTAEIFVPSLLPSELEKIDNLLAQRRSVKLPPAAVREKVMGTKSHRPKTETWLAGQQKNMTQCGYCEKVGNQKMPICSRCKLVRYCDATCQRSAWPAHKPICKVASGARKA